MNRADNATQAWAVTTSKTAVVQSEITSKYFSRFDGARYISRIVATHLICNLQLLHPMFIV